MIAAKNRFNADQRIIAIRAAGRTIQQVNRDCGGSRQIDGQVQGIDCAAITFDQIIAKPAINRIGAITTREIIITISTREGVVSDPTVNGVMIIVTIDGIKTF